MAGAGMTFTHLDPAARRVLEQYTAELAAGLAGPRPVRAAIVAEIADGLTETTAAHQRSGLPPAAAARAAVAEFGDAQLIAAGFGPELAADTGRRIGLGLLATGPLVGLAWLGTALASSDTAGISPPAGLLVLAIVFGAILTVAVPAAGVSVLATGRVSRWLPIGSATAPTAAGLAAMLCMAVDLLLLVGLVAWATTHVGWPGRPRSWPRPSAQAGSPWPAGLRAAASPPPAARLNTVRRRLAMARTTSGIPTRLGSTQKATVGSRFHSGRFGPLST